MGGYGSPTRFSQAQAPGSRGSEGEAAHRMKSLRLTPRQSNKSLASILQQPDERQDSASQSNRRRDLLATKSGLEVRFETLTFCLKRRPTPSFIYDRLKAG